MCKYNVVNHQWPGSLGFWSTNFDKDSRRANDCHISCSRPESSRSRRVLAIVTTIVRHTACTKLGRRSTAYSLIMRWVRRPAVDLLGKEAGVVDIRLREQQQWAVFYQRTGEAEPT
jgi:hypothetical protein